MSFDATKFTVFGISPYVFFAGIGTVVAFFVYNCLLLRSKTDIKLANRAVVFSLPALLLGAKSFGIIANLIESVVYEKVINVDTFLYSGIVFYGGIIFFLISFLFIIRKIPICEHKKMTDSLAVSIPLFHAFGRIGCFTAGCCYGVSTKLVIGVTYTTWVQGAVFTETRIPIQLIESAFNVIIFSLLLWLALHKKSTGHLLKIYIIMYAVVRFVDEFFRGDIDKNILSGFSAAQMISAFLAIFVSVILIKERNTKDVQSR